MRTCMYHKTKAPDGKIFDNDKLESLSNSWVDTPAKFKKEKPEKPEKKDSK